jgi:ribosomal protein S6--L-glutamate ligase/tetrahydromethanopterin:alpha-L-glutamate ligase
LKIAILGKPKTWYTRALQAAFKARDIEAPCFPVTGLVGSTGSKLRLSIGNESLEDYQAVLVRSIPAGSLEQIIYRMDALHRLENAGVRIFNSPSAIERGVDKYYTLTLMEDEGLPVPRTIVTERFDDAMDAFDELGGDVVVKPLFGSEGRGMVRVSDRDMAYRVFRALELGRYVYYLQVYVPHGCEDIRVFVVGDTAVAAMMRRGKTWKTNISNGARAERLRPDKRLADMSVRAAKALGAEYAGVDILPIEGGGYSLIEVNTIPGWKGLKKATGFDAAEYLADFVLKTTH